MVTTAVSPTTQIVLDHWTVDLLDRMPQVNGERYEIIDGALYVTRHPHSRHQMTCDNIIIALGVWGQQTGIGRTIQAPGLVYANDQAVIPDLVWVRRERLATIFDESGHLRESPDLVVEVLSASKADTERDREKKLTLYSRQGVPEYWIVDWRAETIEVYRRNEQVLVLIATLHRDATLSSPLLPGFSCVVARFFEI